jgi:multisubunit Na+/H+ antiporter MnhB subunit
VVLLVLLILARSIYLNAVSTNSFPRDAAQAAYDILFHYLKLGVRILAAVGLLVAVIAYLAGPGRGAVGIRAFFVRMFRGATAEGGALEKVTAFVARWKVGFRIGGVALALLVILASSPSATSVLVILIVLAVYLLLVEWFIRAARPLPSGAA